MSEYRDPLLSWFIGKTIERVERNTDKDSVDFYFAGGLTKRIKVDGDCCSRSWVEHLEVPDDIAGATIISADEPPLEMHNKHNCKPHDYDKSDDENMADGRCGHDVLSVYHTRFRTTKGDIVMEYRNDSNGYYGGNMVDGGEIK